MKKITATLRIIGITSALIAAFIAAIGMPIFVMADATNGTAVTTGTKEFGDPVNSTYTLLEPLPCIAGTGNNCTPGSMASTTNIQTYIVYVFKLMIALAVLAAVVMCIIGGFQYMLTDSVTTKLDAKGTIKNAILGLAGALGSYLILYAINPNLVNVSLVTVPKLNVATTSIDLSPASIPSCDAACTDTKVAAMAAAGVAQDNALADQVVTDQANEKSLADQFAACNPPDSAACQAIYDQYIAAQSKTDVDMGINATTYADNNFAVQTANEAKATNANQVQQEITNIQNEETNALNDCPNDPGCKQQIMQTANVDLTNGQNQQTVVTYTGGTYTSAHQASDARTAAINAINQNTDAQIAKNPSMQQQYTANATAQINAINSADPHIYNPTSTFNTSMP